MTKHISHDVKTPENKNIGVKTKEIDDDYPEWEDFQTKIDNGYYSMKDVVDPSSVEKPMILRNKVDPTTLTEENIKEISKAKEEWEKLSDTKRKEYVAEREKRKAEFRQQLEFHYFTGSLPERIRNEIYGHASCYAGAYGDREMHNRYHEYALLITSVLAILKNE